MIENKDANEKIDAFVKLMVDRTLAGEPLSDEEQESTFAELYQEVKEHFTTETDFFVYLNEEFKAYATSLLE